MTTSDGREPPRTAGRTWAKMDTAFSARPSLTYSCAVSIVKDTYTVEDSYYRSVSAQHEKCYD